MNTLLLTVVIVAAPAPFYKEHNKPKLDAIGVWTCTSYGYDSITLYANGVATRNWDGDLARGKWTREGDTITIRLTDINSPDVHYLKVMKLEKDILVSTAQIWSRYSRIYDGSYFNRR